MWLLKITQSQCIFLQQVKISFLSFCISLYIMVYGFTISWNKVISLCYFLQLTPIFKIILILIVCIVMLILMFAHSRDDVDTGVLRRGCRFLGRVVRASLPFQALLLILLGAAALAPGHREDLCAMTNNLAHSFEPMLVYRNGPPPVWKNQNYC